MTKNKTALGFIAGLALLGTVFTASAANATETGATTPAGNPEAVAAEQVFNRVIGSDDPAAAVKALSPSDHVLFEKWTTVSEPIETTVEEPALASPVAARAAAVCGNFTKRGYFNNGVGAKLGEYWTTGQSCRTNGKLTSVKFTDGGGKTHGLGWSYKGKQTGSGIVGSTGYVYGKYTFELNIAGVQVQKPSYCARTVHTAAVSTGDLVCGL